MTKQVFKRIASSAMPAVNGWQAEIVDETSGFRDCSETLTLDRHDASMAAFLKIYLMPVLLKNRPRLETQLNRQKLIKLGD